MLSEPWTPTVYRTSRLALVMCARAHNRLRPPPPPTHQNHGSAQVDLPESLKLQPENLSIVLKFGSCLRASFVTQVC